MECIASVFIFIFFNQIQTNSFTPKQVFFNQYQLVKYSHELSIY